MERFASGLSEQLTRLTGVAEQAMDAAAQPWTLLQIAVIAVSFVAALAINRRLQPRLEARVRNIRDHPRLLRFLAVTLRRIRWALFALLLWMAMAVIRGWAGPGEGNLVWIAATLVTAWVAISAAARLIRNRLAARLVAIIAWTLLALDLLGILDPVAAELDARALALGSLRVSVLAIFKAIALFAALLWVSGLIGSGVELRLRRSTDLSPSLQVLIGKLVKIGLFLLAAFVSLSAAGLNLTALTLFSGALGLGIGFGLQKAISNFVSGIIILLDKSIKPGDVVELDGTVGWVRSLRTRFVSIVARDGREILVPNEDFITEKVINWSFTDTRSRLDVTFGVSYASDPHTVRRLAREAAAGVARVLPAPAPVCHITGFGESSIDFVLRFWIEDAQNGLTNVRGDVLLALWDALKAANIDIPFPQRDITVRGPVEVRLAPEL